MEGNDKVVIGRSYRPDVPIEYGNGNAIIMDVPQEFIYRSWYKYWFLQSGGKRESLSVCSI
jgi:hypothetical protein